MSIKILSVMSLEDLKGIISGNSNAYKWDAIKQLSNLLISNCNWTQLPDSGLSIIKQLEWQSYRDALRSIQDDFVNPDDVIFPTEPAE